VEHRLGKRRDSSLSVYCTSKGPAGPMKCGSVPGTDERCFSSSKHPNRIWCPPSILFNPYWTLFPKGWKAEACNWPLIPHTAVVKNQWYYILSRCAQRNLNIHAVLGRQPWCQQLFGVKSNSITLHQNWQLLYAHTGTLLRRLANLRVTQCKTVFNRGISINCHKCNMVAVFPRML
jgi:hypothetical protein